MPKKVTGGALAAISQFDSYPDSANVRLPVACAVLGCSGATIYRMARRGVLTPRKMGSRLTGWNVGELRAAAKGV